MNPVFSSFSNIDPRDCMGETTIVKLSKRSLFDHRNRNQRQNQKKPTLPTLFWPKQATTPVW
jgi:hypothetical protein